MKKPVRILLIVISALLLIIILLPLMFKGRIEKAVKDEVNKTINAFVDWEGYSMSLFRNFPDFTFRIRGLTVIGIEEFSEDTLASIPSFSFSVNLRSVIRGSDFVVNSIVLNRPSVKARVLQSGKANWDIMKEVAVDTTVAEMPPEPSNFSLSIKRLEIKNARIIYDDASINTKLKLENLDFYLKGDMTASQTKLFTKTDVGSLTADYEGVRYLSKAVASLKADFDADLDKYIFTFLENELRVNELFLGFEGVVAMPDEGFDIDVNFFAAKTEFKNILSLVPAIYAKDFEDVKTEGILELNGHAKGLYAENSLPAFALNLIVENAMFQYPELPESVRDIYINLNVSNPGLTPDHTIINLTDFKCNIAGNTAGMNMIIKTPVSDPNVNGAIKGRIDLESIAKVYTLEEEIDIKGIFDADVRINGSMSSVENERYEEFQAEGAMQITNLIYKDADFSQGLNIREARLVFTPRHLDLTSFDMMIGKNDMQAKGKVYNYMAYVFRDELLKGSFTTSSNYFNLNDFLVDETAEPVQAKDEEAESIPLQAFDVPANIDFELRSVFGKLIYDNMEMLSVRGKIVIRDKRLTLDNLGMETLGGSILMSGYYDSRNLNRPEVDFALSLNGIDVRQSYKAFVTVRRLAPIAAHTSGRFSMDVKMNSGLNNDLSPDLASLNANGKLSARALSVKGSKVFVKIAEEIKMDQFKELTLQSIMFDFAIKDGQLEVKPFDLKMGEINSNISGSSGLDQTLAYLIKFDIPRSIMGAQANQIAGGLVDKANKQGGNFSLGERLNIDAFVSGTVTEPKLTIGMKGTLDNAVDDLVNKVKQEAKDRIEDVKDEITDKAQQELDKAKAEAERLKKEAEERAKAEMDAAKSKAEQEAEAARKRAEQEAEAARKKAEEDAKKKAEEELRKRVRR